MEGHFTHKEGIQISVISSPELSESTFRNGAVINAIPLRGARAGLEQVLAEICRQIGGFSGLKPILLVSREWKDAHFSELCLSSVPGDVPVLGIHTGGGRLSRILTEQTLLPRLCGALKARLVFSLCNVSPILFSGPQYVMVHDLHWFRRADLFSRPQDHFRAAYVRRGIALSIARSCRIYTGSPHSAQDITAMFGREARVFPWGARRLFYEKNQEACPVEGDYILFVGQTNRRKNIPALLRALRGHGFPPLVIAGSPGDGEQEILQTARPGEIIRLGEPDDRSVHTLMSHARAMVYPSLYEGFGLPVIEAMASGCPVAAAGVTSIPFVAGDAAVLMDPFSASSMRDAVAQALDKREDLIARGRKRAAEMSMEQAVRNLLNDVLSDGR